MERQRSGEASNTGTDYDNVLPQNFSAGSYSAEAGGPGPVPDSEKAITTSRECSVPVVEGERRGRGHWGSPLQLRSAGPGMKRRGALMVEHPSGLGAVSSLVGSCGSVGAGLTMETSGGESEMR